jgi:hypothetical protein
MDVAPSDLLGLYFRLALEPCGLGVSSAGAPTAATPRKDGSAA